MRWNFGTFLAVFWALLLLFLLYVYFFQPQLFNQMFEFYPGPGSPYINNP